MSQRGDPIDSASVWEMTVAWCGGVDPEQPKEAKMRSNNFDLEYCQNNCTIAIRPSRTGRLKGLVRTTADDTDRVWVFKSVESYTDDDGDERIDHGTLGLVSGYFSDGGKFLHMCRELGLVVQSSGFFVPFSNGKHRYGTVGHGDEAGPTSEYYESELKMARWDLPTRDQLVLVLNADTE